VEAVRSGIAKIPTVKDLQVVLKPATARFTVDFGKATLQDVVIAVRKAGKPFDGKLLLQQDPKLSESTLEALDKALEAVPGVKNTGAPDENGMREITLDLKQKTTLADLLKASRSVGVELKVPAK
jgi:hypothetical protein